MRIEIQENVLLAPYTIYKIGGLARFFVNVKNEEELKHITKWAAKKGAPIFILGAGSNVLISDRGFGGLVIHLTGGEVKIEGERLIADAGVMMARAVLESAKAGLSGFEWGIGVPGTIGGSIRGNAGCFSGEMAQVVERVRLFELKVSVKGGSVSGGKSAKLKVTELNNNDCEFSYRDSIFKRHPEWIIISAVLKLKNGELKKIQENIKRIITQRAAKQDIGTKSCGCIFKNISWARKGVDQEKLLKRFPELSPFKDQPNIPASFLIDQAGLKGRRVGKVFVSPKHANYFVNDGDATAEEVMMLVLIVKDMVRERFGISLEEEIQYVGF